jgi:competence protein ComEC
MINTLPVFKNGRTSFLFQTEEAQFNNVRFRTCGDILVYVKGNLSLEYGQELILGGNLYRPYYLRRGNISLVMNARVMHFSNASEKNRGFFLKRFAFYLKRKIENIIFQYLPSVPASILDAMLLGERKMLSPLINNSMIKSGTVHILVVSGFNTTLVALIIISILKLFRLSRRISFYITAPLLVIYCLMTGASSPVVRASIMAIVFMGAYLLKREADIYNSCAIAAGFILVVNPHQLFDIGFQLSFVSVLSIVYLYPKLKSFLFRDGPKVKYVRIFVEGFLISLSAWLGTMGFIAWYFKIFSPITVIANIFIVPLAALITLCGFALVAMGILCPVIAPVFASTNELLVIVLLNINAFLLKIPGAYFNL